MATTDTSEVQTTDQPTTLKGIIKDLQSDTRETFWPDEAGWRQYVKDHYAELKAQASIEYITPNDMRKYAYSIGAYLKEKGHPVSIGWIVLWLNQVESILHLDQDTIALMIPNHNQLVQMRQQYITNRVTLKKANGNTDL